MTVQRLNQTVNVLYNQNYELKDVETLRRAAELLNNSTTLCYLLWSESIKTHLGIRVLVSNHVTYDDSDQNHESYGKIWKDWSQL